VLGEEQRPEIVDARAAFSMQKFKGYTNIKRYQIQAQITTAHRIRKFLPYLFVHLAMFSHIP